MNLPAAARPFLAFAEQSATAHGLPVSLLLATMSQESGFRASAYRAEPKINDGSHGLMQLLYRTADSLGYKGPVGEASTLTGLYDPATNIALGAKLLAQNLKLAGHLAGAISAYNGGYRPNLGFGRPAVKALVICLARDQVTGKCIRTRAVPAGEYSNASYVQAVLARMHAYDGPDVPHAA